uniref:Uncharacterized protein n=1 Tax=Rhizophora mucronata TaxID=61149 RepID=A0A2P2N7H3_RHIMU
MVYALYSFFITCFACKIWIFWLCIKLLCIWEIVFSISLVYHIHSIGCLMESQAVMLKQSSREWAFQSCLTSLPPGLPPLASFIVLGMS